MNNYPAPATLHGTVFKCDTKLSKAGKQYKSISLSLYNGKNADKTYRPSTWVNVTYFGNKDFTIREKYTFSGHLELSTYMKDGVPVANASLLCFDDEPQLQPQSQQGNYIPF